MRIWDVNPGYLNRQSLLGEHRELHAIVSIIRNKKTGYSRHPETLRWQGFGWALSQRHRLLAAEMNLRGYTDRTPVLLKIQPRQWPLSFVDPPADQFRILSRKYKNTDQGRIPLPRTMQELWLQHKYSVMARDEAEYQYIGGWIESRKGGGMKTIYPELVALLRRPPVAGNLENTLRRMVTDLCAYASLSPDGFRAHTASRLLDEIRHLAFLYHVAFLKESTALGELPSWTDTTRLRHVPVPPEQCNV